MVIPEHIRAKASEAAWEVNGGQLDSRYAADAMEMGVNAALDAIESAMDVEKVEAGTEYFWHADELTEPIYLLGWTEPSE